MASREFWILERRSVAYTVVCILLPTWFGEALYNQKMMIKTTYKWSVSSGQGVLSKEFAPNFKNVLVFRVLHLELLMREHGSASADVIIE